MGTLFPPEGGGGIFHIIIDNDCVDKEKRSSGPSLYRKKNLFFRGVCPFMRRTLYNIKELEFTGFVCSTYIRILCYYRNTELISLKRYLCMVVATNNLTVV